MGQGEDQSRVTHHQEAPSDEPRAASQEASGSLFSRVTRQEEGEEVWAEGGSRGGRFAPFAWGGNRRKCGERAGGPPFFL